MICDRIAAPARPGHLALLVCDLIPKCAKLHPRFSFGIPIDMKNTPNGSLISAVKSCAVAAGGILADATRAVAMRVDGLSGPALDAEQRATHGLAWIATYATAIDQVARYLESLEAPGELETDLACVLLGEYMAQLVSGIPMSQSEIVAPGRSGVDASADRRTLGAGRGFLGTGEYAGTAHAHCARAGGRSGAARHARRNLARDARRDAQIHRRRDRRQGASLASGQRLYPARHDRQNGGFGRVRPNAARGLWRAWPRQRINVRRVRRTFARLYRRWLVGYTVGDRGRVDPRFGHASAEATLSARHRVGRDSADGGVHRARYRLRPRVDPHARGA